MSGHVKITVINKTGTALRNRLARMADMLEEKNAARAGWLGSDKYANGESIADVAHTQEFGFNGWPEIPARPFMRPAFRRGVVKWRRRLFIGMYMELRKRNGGSLEKVFQEVGEMMAEDIKKCILEVHSPKLADYTIRQRIRQRGIQKQYKNNGLTANVHSALVKPLIDTGTMINSVKHWTHGGKRL